MSILTRAQATTYASQAGFSGAALDTIVAIAQAESSLNTNAQHVNTDGSVDRGILQINSRWHPEVSDSCAYNAACAFQSGYKISSNGSNFGPWATYTSGLYLRYLSSGFGGVSTSQGTKPWFDYPITNGYLPQAVAGNWDSPHFGIDFATPVDTPFFFPKSGVIKSQDYGPWGGEIYLNPDDGSTTELVGHLDVINTKPGQHVVAGQVVGLTGGQLSGGSHPTSPAYSSGPHTIFQYFTGFAKGEQGLTVASGPDVTPLVDELIAGQLPGVSTATDGTLLTTTADTTATSDSSTPVQQKQSIGTTVNNVLSELPGFGGIALALDVAEQFPGVIWYNVNSTVNLVPGGAVGDVINGVASAIFDPQDYIGAAFRSILDTIFSNTVAFLVRGFIVSIGLLLVAGLIWNALDSSGITQNFAEIGAAAV